MADAFTTQSSSTFAKTLWSKALQWPYRDELHFDQVAEAASTTEAGFRGKEVTWTYPQDIALATTELDEIVGPDAVTFTTATQTVTLKEWGNTMKSSALARTTSFVDLNEVMINILGYNAGASIDTIAASALVAGTTNIQRANGRVSNVTIAATDVLTTKELEIAYTEMSVANVPTFGGYYNLYAHPYQIHDLRLETGAGGFRQMPEQSGVGSTQLINHTMGEWAGFRIIMGNRTPFTANIGVGGTVDIYKAVAVGRGGFVKAYSDHPEAPGGNPEVRFGLSVDAMMRNKPVSWYALQNYKVVRDAAVKQIYTASSRGAN